MRTKCSEACRSVKFCNYTRSCSQFPHQLRPTYTQKAQKLWVKNEHLSLILVMKRPKHETSETAGIYKLCAYTQVVCVLTLAVLQLAFHRRNLSDFAVELLQRWNRSLLAVRDQGELWHASTIASRRSSDFQIDQHFSYQMARNRSGGYRHSTLSSFSEACRYDRWSEMWRSNCEFAQLPKGVITS